MFVNNRFICNLKKKRNNLQMYYTLNKWRTCQKQKKNLTNEVLKNTV